MPFLTFLGYGQGAGEHREKEGFHMLDTSKRWRGQFVRDWITKGFLWHVHEFAFYPENGIEGKGY